MLEMTKDGLVEADPPRRKKTKETDRKDDDIIRGQTDGSSHRKAVGSPRGETDEGPRKEADETIDVYDISLPYSRIFIRCTRRCYFVREPALSEHRAALKDRIVGLMRHSKELTSADEDRNVRKAALEKAFDRTVEAFRIPLDEETRRLFLYYIYRDLIGFGKIEAVLNDTLIEDVSCSGYGLPVYVHHRLYGSLRTTITFEPEELDALVRRMAHVSGKSLTIAKPLVDAALPDGSRAQLSLGNEITTRGSTFTVRRFTKEPFRPEDLVRMRTVTPDIMAYLKLAVESNMNIMFAGGTASGKTTTVNAVSRFIPPCRKIVSIEDTREISLPHLNWISGVSRDPVIMETAADNGRSGTPGLYGRISLYDLLKTSMRQRPEYIIVGEVRGEEAYVLFQAMSTGHATLSTIHAESADRLIRRLENPPMSVPRTMIQALDILVILGTVRVRGRDVKRCLAVHEIIRTDPKTEEVIINDIFRYEKRNENTINDIFDRSKVVDKIILRTGQKPYRILTKLKEYTNVFEEVLRENNAETAPESPNETKNN